MVSIIIPHFNRSLLLKETIHSVMNQTSEDWEIIIVDDNSDKAEWAMVKSYEGLDNRIKVYERQSGNKGPSACRNEAVQKSNSAYLIFLDSDDLLKPFCIQQRLNFMRTHQETEMAVFLEENFKEIPGDLNSLFNIDMPYEKLLGSFLQNQNPWQTMAPIWKKSFFKKLDGFDEELIYMEDPELHIRALLDVNTQVEICYDLPADCYYRINYTDGTKKDFYYNSIHFRLLFYKKIIVLLTEKGLLPKYLQDIKRGVYYLLRNFMYARIKEYPALYQELLNLLSNNLLFGKKEKNKIKWLIDIGNSSTPIARVFRLKGLCYRMLPSA